jgi:hypothetical protein
MAELKHFPVKHFSMNAPQLVFEDSIFKVRQKYYAECVDMQESAIVEAVIRLAREAGVTELYLLDKRFVADALTVAIEKWRAENG